MENMDKGLIVPIWVLINRPKIPQTPKNLSAQIVYPGPKFWNFDEKRLHWASIVCVLQHVAKEKKLKRNLEKHLKSERHLKHLKNTKGHLISEFDRMLP